MASVLQILQIMLLILIIGLTTPSVRYEIFYRVLTLTNSESHNTDYPTEFSQTSYARSVLECIVSCQVFPMEMCGGIRFNVTSLECLLPMSSESGDEIECYDDYDEDEYKDDLYCAAKEKPCSVSTKYFYHT